MDKSIMTSMTSTYSDKPIEPLTLASMAKTLEELDIAPKVPLLEFKLDAIGWDIGKEPDTTMLSVFGRRGLVHSFKVEPIQPAWGLLLSSMLDDTPSIYTWHTRVELRRLRKLIRDKKGKARLKSIARNPLLSEQDPRKLRRLARRSEYHADRIILDDPCYPV